MGNYLVCENIYLTVERALPLGFACVNENSYSAEVK